MSLSVIFDILRLIVEVLTAHNKCSLSNRKKLLQPIQMQLCEKQKVFTQFLATILKSASNFYHFEKI